MYGSNYRENFAPLYDLERTSTDITHGFNESMPG
jgi:hypothetical protein